jgi:hypothetical protein
MATYEEIMAAAQNAKAEGRDGAARFLATRAYELRTGRPFSVGDAENPEDVYDPTVSEGVAQEFFEGIFSGGTRIVQGVLETGAAAADLVGDTDFAPQVTEAFEAFRERAGIDPVGLVGKGAEVITQFVIPGGLAARAVGNLSKAGRIGTAIRQIAAAGAVDAVVSDNDTTTIGDFFEGGPTQRDEMVGLTGRDEALRRIANKLRVGAESGAAQIIAPLAISAAARGAGKAALAVDRVPGLRVLGPVAAARGVQRLAKPIGARLGRIEEALRTGQKVGSFGRMLGETLAATRYRGMLPEEVAEARLLSTGQEEAGVQQALALSARINSSLDGVLKKMNRMAPTATPLTRADALNTIEEFLTTKNPARRTQLFNSIPQDLRSDVQQMRTMVDDLSQQILGGDFMKRFGQTQAKNDPLNRTIEQVIKGNLGSYMRRRYRIFEDTGYQPTQDVINAAAQGFKNDKSSVEAIFGELIQKNKATPADLGVNVSPAGKITGPVSDEQAQRAVTAFLDKYRKARGQKNLLSRVAEKRVPTDLFITRKNLKDYQKALIGEVKNPLENFVATVADLAEFKAVDDYFSRVRSLADDPNNANTFGRWFRNTEKMSPVQKRALQEDDGYRILGEGDKDPLQSGWGSLQGYAVPERIYRDLTRTVAGDLNVVGNSARSLYNTFLRAKGFTQFGTVVLSPATQIRNVTTAALYSTMQGNVGRGANLWESMRLVFDNLPQGQVTDMFTKLQRLGVVGSQAELREMQDLISKGFGFDQPARMLGGLPTGRRIGSRWTDNPIGAFVAGSGRKAQNLYQAGDDLWKIYNFQFERRKLLDALQSMGGKERQAYIDARGGAGKALDDFLDEEAAYVVRNVIPNYNMVPEAVRFLRRMPVGNFIAFPSEIIRTSVNTLSRALDELADPNRAIQEIGMRRITGMMGTVGIIGPTLSKLAYQTSGVSEEEMDAYRRSLAAPWERNARLIPVGRHEDGTPKYINFSYSNPYDMIERMFTAALNKQEEGRLLGKSSDQIAFEAFSESFGELVAPFTEESIVTGALRDVLDPNSQVPGVRQLGQLVGGRGGSTLTGARVYSTEDSAGDRARKSVNHVFGTILPSIVPIDTRGGELEPSRFARGFVNTLGLNEELGVDPEDRRGIERRLSAELARVFSGIAESESQATQGLIYRGFEFSQRRRTASGIFNSVARRPNVTSQELLDAFVRADEARYRVFNQFYRTVEDLRAIGMSDREIRRILDQNNIGGVNQLLRGRYEPLDVSKEIRQVMRRNGRLDQLPRSEIQEYRRQRRQIGYGPVEEAAPAPEAPAGAGNPLMGMDQAQGAAPAAPVVGPVPAAPGPQPSAQPARTAPPPLELLGSNPFEALRNLGIAQRPLNQ